MENKKFLLAYDFHYPFYCRHTWVAVLDFLKQNKVDGFVWGGDQLDLSEISHHTKGKSIHRPRGAMARNLRGFDKYGLSKVEALLSPEAARIWITGNHERFLQDLLDEQPELEGMLSIEGHLRLKERGWKVIPLGGHYELGHLTAIHGETVGGGMNPAKKAVEIWCASVVMGHHHTSQAYTKASPVHKKKKWTATVLPCLSTVAPTYGRGRANTWLNGVGIAEVRSSRDFNLYTAIITDGQFSYGGKVYGKSTKKAA